MLEIDRHGQMSHLKHHVVCASACAPVFRLSESVIFIFTMGHTDISTVVKLSSVWLVTMDYSWHSLANDNLLVVA